MWKFMFVLLLVIYLTNAIPIDAESDIATSPEKEGISRLALDLKPPPVDAEITDYSKSDKSIRSISTDLQLPKVISVPFDDRYVDDNIKDDKSTLPLKLVPPEKEFDPYLWSLTSISSDLEPPKKDYIEEDFSSLPSINTELEPPKHDFIEDSFLPPLSSNSETPKITSITEDKSALESSEPEQNENITFGAVFIINLYAVKNVSGENTSEILDDDVAKQHPVLLEPVATVLLVLREDDEDTPLDLDLFAKDLEEEGMKVEKFSDDGETKVIKVDFDSLDNNEVEQIDKEKGKSRKRRHGLISKIFDKHRGRNCDVCGGGGGGGYHQGGTVGVIPVVVVPVQQQPVHYQPRPRPHPRPHYQPQPQYVQPQPHYVQPQPHYVQPQPQPVYVQPRPHPQPVYQQPGCNTCGGGNHGSYSQSSAQASAQSSSGSW